MITTIYKGSIESLNPFPKKLREDWYSDFSPTPSKHSSIENFKDQMLKIGREMVRTP